MRGFKNFLFRGDIIVVAVGLVDPPPVKTCPACLSSDLPATASTCKYCGTDQPATA